MDCLSPSISLLQRVPKKVPLCGAYLMGAGGGLFLGHEVALAFSTVQDPLLGQQMMLPCICVLSLWSLGQSLPSFALCLFRCYPEPCTGPAA